MKAASFWRLKTTKESYPRLRRVALHYLSIPLSTASVERAFSKLTRMESPLRMSLLDENVRRQHSGFIQCHKSAVVGKLAAAVDSYEKLVKKKKEILAEWPESESVTRVSLEVTRPPPSLKLQATSGPSLEPGRQPSLAQPWTRRAAQPSMTPTTPARTT